MVITSLQLLFHFMYYKLTLYDVIFATYDVIMSFDEVALKSYLYFTAHAK